MDTQYCLADKIVAGGSASVCGIGISNLPLIDFLLGRGMSVVARDKKSREQLGADMLERLEQMGVSLVLGEGYLAGICEDIVFRTPGMRPDTPELLAAQARGSALGSEMELFFELTPAHIIAITGSDGKTTTTTLTYKMLQAHIDAGGKGKVFVGGNIGAPLLPLVEQMTEHDYAVVELSSFQLMSMHRSPERAAITNITPNHLDWHRGMEEYIEAKRRICRGAECKHLTVNADNAETVKIGMDSNARVTFISSQKSRYDEIVPSVRCGDRAIFLRDDKIIFSDGIGEKELLCTSEILLPGRHNVENYMTAIANVYDIVNLNDIKNVAGTFAGVEHRLEFVRELDGVKYYNSSIDSTPTRTAAALSALSVKPVVICGGYDKKIPFAPLAEALAERAAGVVLTGDTAEKILTALHELDADIGARLSVSLEQDLESAVMTARKMAGDRGTVLLSPACASFDRFKNFEERGRAFKKIVNNLK